MKLLLGGDVMLGRLVNEVLQQRGPRHPLAALAPLRRDADLWAVNLECAITPRHQHFRGAPKAFYFVAEPIAADALSLAHVDVVSLANNHALDADAEGLADTKAALAAHDIAAAGAGNDRAAAFAPALIERAGTRLAFLACCDHQPDFAASDARAGIAYCDLQSESQRRDLLERVASAAKLAAHVIVAFHWMANWVPAIPALYRRLARDLVEAGARVVWGHSPHHILGSEWFGTAVALYSTGDLVDDYAVDARYRNDRQLVYELTLGAGAVERVRARPVELKLGHTVQAGQLARDWIGRRLTASCEAVGSRVERLDDSFLIERVAG